MHDPIAQFVKWLKEETQCCGKADPTAMSLATIGEDGYPDCRIVLFKGLVDEKGQQGLSFYTNYNSKKGHELSGLPKAAFTWYWPETYRQVRMVGDVEKLSDEQSDTYFDSRPKESRASAIVSPQSEVILSRHALQESMTQLLEQETLGRPLHWGGYCLLPHRIEFWQGKKHRLHDRSLYKKENNSWVVEHLAP